MMWGSLKQHCSLSARLFLAVLLCMASFSTESMLQPTNITHAQPCMTVKDGYCVEEVLQEMFELQKPLWPAKIDVVMLMSPGHVYQAQLVFRSLELFWPRYLGTVNIVLDAGCDLLVPILPKWVKVHYIDWSANIPGVVMWIAKEWWEFWVDTVTTAPYVAILDSDAIFDTPVTPDLVFNPENGKLRMISRQGGNRYKWAPATNYLLGKGYHDYDFMSALPWFFPRAWLGELRQDILDFHPEANGNFGAVFQGWNNTHHFNTSQFIAAFSTQGNWAWRKRRHEIDWSIDGETGDNGKTPLWMNKHISYSRRFDSEAAHNKLHAQAGKASASYIYEGLCSAFPPGTVAGCSDQASRMQKNLLEFESRFSCPDNEWNMKPVNQHFAMLHALYTKAIAALRGKASNQLH